MCLCFYKAVASDEGIRCLYMRVLVPSGFDDGVDVYLYVCVFVLELCTPVVDSYTSLCL